MFVAAQVHLWPWSASSPGETYDMEGDTIAFPYYGSPLISLTGKSRLLLPTRHEKFIPLGPVSAHGARLFEAPHGVLVGSVSRIKILDHGRSFPFHLKVEGARERFADAKLDGQPVETSLAKLVMAWAQYFDDLIDQQTARDGPANLVPWGTVLDFIRSLSKEVRQPKRALIVKISETLHKTIPATVNGARKVLLRERRLVPMNHLQETDRACLRWYVRQPGTTPAQKAGQRQRLLGIARCETYDLHENRILKDFLRRSARESQRYLTAQIGDDPALRATERARLVSGFGAQCTYLRRAPTLEEVSRPTPSTPANYVLLNDSRYREVWHWYRKLLRREEDEDRFWDWQARTWADIVRLLVNSAFVFHLDKSVSRAVRDGLVFEEVLKSSLHVRREQQLGTRVRSGTEPGPILVRRLSGGHTREMAVLEIIHPDEAGYHPVCSNLGGTGAHLSLALTHVEPVRSAQTMILVWAAHTAATNYHPSWEEIATSACRALTGHESVLVMSRKSVRPKLAGLVACSELELSEAIALPEQSRLRLVRVPAMPEGWMSGVLELGIAIEELLEEVL